MYKLSKYSFNCLNSDGELLLYNTFIGEKSFCKICRSDLQNTFITNFNFLNENIKNKLLMKGIIVPINLNEDLALDNLIMQFMSPNDLSLTISPTENCNFRCKYCYESHNNMNMPQNIQEDIIKYVKKNLFKFSDLNINWFGGEPLLDIDRIIKMSQEFKKICKLYKRGFSSAMTTNGYLLNMETFQKLLKAGINIFQITIDGIEEVHDNQRPYMNGNTTYKTILNNLFEIKKLKIRSFEKVNIYFTN